MTDTEPVSCPFCFAERDELCVNVMTDEPVAGVVHRARTKERARQESISGHTERER